MTFSRGCRRSWISGSYVFAALLVAVVGCMGVNAQPQTGQSGVPAVSACSLSGQFPEAGPFDRSQVEFVSGPPAALPAKPSLSFQTISRVIGLQPLVFETLDISLDDRTSMLLCQRTHIKAVDARLRDTLPQLRFNDLVKATMAMAEGGSAKLVLSGLEKISGTPAFFHEHASVSICPNRTGTLAAYSQPSGETVIVHNDGSISYEDARFNEFNQQQLDPAEMARLLAAFQNAGFDALASEPPINDIESQPSVTLICARHQRVPVPGHEAALAPVIRAIEQAKAKALSETYYLLSISERREITFLEWPFPRMPLEKMPALEEASRKELLDACKEKRRPQGAYLLLNQQAPAWFFGLVP